MLLPSCTSLPPPFCQSPGPATASPTLLRAPKLFAHTHTHVCMWGGGPPHPAGWLCMEHNSLWLRVSERASAFSVTQKWSE